MAVSGRAICLPQSRKRGKANDYAREQRRFLLRARERDGKKREEEKKDQDKERKTKRNTKHWMFLKSQLCIIYDSKIFANILREWP